jgi:hypothetical protein
LPGQGRCGYRTEPKSPLRELVVLCVARMPNLPYDATLMRVGRLLLFFLVAILSLVVWLWWTAPRQTDMTAYVPAESLFYLEVNNLRSIATDITHTDAWRVLPADSKFRSELLRVTWLSRLARWTGIGSAEEVILARSQFALVVMAFDATDDQPTLRIRPVAALVIETHTPEGRMRPAIERRIEQLAHRVYPQSRTLRTMVDGIEFVEWISPNDDRRIVAAFLGSVAIVGNDEQAVRACSSVRRGSTPSLASNKDLKLMRARLSADRAAAFGYVSSSGLGNLLAFTMPLYVERLSDSGEAHQFLAGAAGRILQGAGWTAAFKDGSVEDRYFVSLSPGVASALREAVATPPGTSSKATLFLPDNIYSVTQYNLRDPRLAWAGFNRALTSHVDVLGAVLLTPLLKAGLWSYGIDDPDAFLGAIGPEIVTTRLDEAATTSVLIVQVRDEPTLQRLVSGRLGSSVRKERVGPYEMVSSVEGSLSASFSEQLLLLGPPESVRRCLTVRSQQSSVDLSQFSSGPVSSIPPLALTYTRDVESAQRFLSLVSESQDAHMDRNAKLLSEKPYAVSATTFTGDGFERTTHSTFGLLATLAVQLASEFSGK